MSALNSPSRCIVIFNFNTVLTPVGVHILFHHGNWKSVFLNSVTVEINDIMGQKWLTCILAFSIDMMDFGITAAGSQRRIQNMVDVNGQ